MTACSPGHRRVGDGEPALRHAWRSTCARWPPRCAPSTARSSTAACCCRSTRPTSPSSATRCSRDRPLVGVPRAGSSSSSTPSTARSRASTRPTSGSTCAGATTRGRTPTTSPFDEIQPLLYEAHVGALVISMANARHAHEVPLLRATRPLPDRHGARRRRDRHDEQLRRAPRGGRRPDRPASSRPSATRPASSPAPTAGSTRRPASATSRRPSCGRSCAPCGPAPTWRRNGCSDRFRSCVSERSLRYPRPRW